MVKNNNAKHRLSRCSDCELNKQLTADKDTQRSQGFWCITQQELFPSGFDPKRQVVSSAHADFEMKTRSSVRVVCQRRLSRGGRKEMSGAASFSPTSERTRSMLITANYAKFWLIIREPGDGRQELDWGAWKPPVNVCVRRYWMWPFF